MVVVQEPYLPSDLHQPNQRIDALLVVDMPDCCTSPHGPGCPPSPRVLCPYSWGLGVGGWG